MKSIILSITALSTLAGCATLAEPSPTERNKDIARQFYENRWFSNNTEAYADFVADTYVVHDV